MNKRKNKKIFIIAIFFILLWLNNTSLFSKKDNTGYKFLLHRGLAQVLMKQIQIGTATLRL